MAPTVDDAAHSIDECIIVIPSTLHKLLQFIEVGPSALTVCLNRVHCIAKEDITFKSCVSDLSKQK